ncbi:MAG: hypothetical protein AW07_00903 [Candidatus Accumulibacter sp. SK-11]|nr:MAG: hypothetical protein AW07_00903 [Candidatus Accumulibacter sp. SK-11]
MAAQRGTRGCTAQVGRPLETAKAARLKKGGSACQETRDQYSLGGRVWLRIRLW